MMYTRDYPTDVPNDIPTGYAGNAFPPSPPSRETPQPEEAIETGAAPHRPKRKKHDIGTWLSRFSHLGDLNLRSLFSGDLLLIAVALLLVTSGEDDCEDSGDLWILLLLLYFMK